MWKDFFYYTKSERRIIIFLFVLAAILVVANLFLKNKENVNSITSTGNTAQIDSFLYSIKVDKSKRDYHYNHKFTKNNTTEQEKKNSQNNRHKTEIKLSEFDPNTADSHQLLTLGLSSFTVNNIIKYRKKGGKFRTPESLRKIYGMDEKTFLTLRPYITIHPSFAPHDTSRIYTKIEKYAPGTIICINTADTAQLKKVPGIGSYIARRIVEYRNRLGVFYSINQLQEIPHATESLNKWFTLGEYSIQKIKLNSCNIKQLQVHPYISYSKAKSIMEYRKRYGKIKSISALSMIEGFTDEDISKLKHYISFE